MTDEYRKNPADVAAEIIKKKAAGGGLELADDFEERVAEARHYLEQPDGSAMMVVFGEGHGELLGRPFRVEPWTTEYPTREGYYWLRNYRFDGESRINKEPVVALVSIEEYHRREGGIVYDKVFSLVGDSAINLLTWLVSAEWYGPIEPPE